MAIPIAGDDCIVKLQSVLYKDKFIAYKSRWYVLILFSLLSSMNSMIYGTFGPIASGLMYAYPSFDEADVSTTVLNGSVSYLIFTIPLCLVLEKRGIRETTVGVTGLALVGACMRVLSTNEIVFITAAHSCAVLNGILSVLVSALSPAISSAWFKENERTTATCISIVFGNIGAGLGNIVGPYFIHYDSMIPGHNKSESSKDDFITPSEMKLNISWYLASQALLLSVLFLAILIYFPSKPKTPPTASSAVKRLNTGIAIRKLISQKSTILCIISYSIVYGVFGHWQCVMTLNFEPLGITDRETGIIGLAATFGGVVVSILIATLSDHIKNYLKIVIMLLISSSMYFFLWLFCIVLEVIDYNRVYLWISTIGGMVILSSTRPLFFEYAAEISYPVPEGLIGGILNAGFNVVGVIFLAIFYFPNIGFSWMNYALVASIFISLPLLMLSKEEFSRAELDRNGLKQDKIEHIHVISLPKTPTQNDYIRGNEFTARG